MCWSSRLERNRVPCVSLSLVTAPWNNAPQKLALTGSSEEQREAEAGPCVCVRDTQKLVWPGVRFHSEGVTPNFTYYQPLFSRWMSRKFPNNSTWEVKWSEKGPKRPKMENSWSQLRCFEFLYFQNFCQFTDIIFWYPITVLIAVYQRMFCLYLKMW